MVDLKTIIKITAQAYLMTRTNHKIKMHRPNKRKTTISKPRSLLRTVRINTIEEVTSHRARGRMKRRTTSLDKDLQLLSQQLSRT